MIKKLAYGVGYLVALPFMLTAAAGVLIVGGCVKAYLAIRSAA